MKILIIVSTLLLASCGQLDNIKDPRPILTTNEAFKPYIKRFESFYGKSIGDIPVNFATLNNDFVGACNVWGSGHKNIEVDFNHWNTLNESQKEILIFHELGHCVLELDHVKSSNNECPKSIMRANLFNVWEIDSCYTFNYENYINELFSK